MYQLQIENLLAGARHGRITGRDFRSELPDLHRQLSCDRDSDALGCWGLSSNFDENAGATIVDRKLLTTIGRVVRFPVRTGTAYHAGLMHTYGYLLSTLQTPYGFKHERWTSGRLESGLGLPPGTLLAGDGQSTLLQNVTALFLGLIGQAERITEFEGVDRGVLDLVSRTNTSTKWRYRITEAIEIQGDCRYELNSYIVPLDSDDPSCSALLIYSVRVGDARPQLITGFPMSQASLDELLESDSFGTARALRPRYNAVIPGFPSEGFGSRELVEQSVS